MSDKDSKRGRRPGTSRHAKEDLELLERMYAPCKQGEPVQAAAGDVVGKMEWSDLTKRQAIERLRKKFRKFSEEKERQEKERLEKERQEMASRTPPPEPQVLNTTWAQISEQVRRYDEIRRTPEGKAAIEHAHRLSQDKVYCDFVRDAVESTRWAHKIGIL